MQDDGNGGRSGSGDKNAGGGKAGGGGTGGGGGSAIPSAGGRAVLGPRADQVGVANRTAVDISGSFTGCTEHSKTAAKCLDSHVVTCHRAGKGDCSSFQTKFLDDNRTIYAITGGTHVAKMLSDGATCAARPE